ncbi:MAG: 16S rRNA (guanine(966)-N(2))-methyltransferase RsmD [Gammaproteobacteria bacterium]|nr:16S rRNA (guanine(966)-N(2))-methyltransferase RsmD [Gammaproteobacteria bacterium]
MSSKQAKAARPSAIRIIGGRWRGSRLAVLDKPGLRPTPDRVRETLFNWLAVDIPGARVLDCFSGAGGLGFEAASREARAVVMVDRDHEIIAQLRANAERLQADDIEIQHCDIMQYLGQASGCFDVVFIDPPYADQALRSLTLQRLIERDLLCPGARIYLEWPSAEDMPLEDAGLHWVRQKTAGQVTYAIAQWQ